ncbi:alpha-(1-_3)-arabinofuranosyltransferase family protein [Nonomuraea ferruginea]
MSESPGVTKVRSFGEPVGDVFGDDAVDSLDAAFPALDLYEVSEPSDLVTVRPAADALRVRGGPDSLLSMGDLGLLGDGPVLVNDDAAGVEAPSRGERRAAAARAALRRAALQHQPDTHRGPAGGLQRRAGPGPDGEGLAGEHRHRRVRRHRRRLGLLLGRRRRTRPPGPATPRAAPGRRWTATCAPAGRPTARARPRASGSRSTCPRAGRSPAYGRCSPPSSCSARRWTGWRSRPRRAAGSRTSSRPRTRSG